MDNRKLLPIIVIVLVVIATIVLFSNSIFITIGPGERGVIFRKFGDGLDKENVFMPGFHVKAPWNNMYVYDVREATIDEKMDVLDKKGLTINVDVSVRFHPIYQRTGYLHERFGNNYVDRLVIPEVRSTVRRVMGRYTAEEIYSTKRAEVEDAIIKETEGILKSDENNIAMKALLIRSINLPEQIKKAIEDKLQQEQEALAYEFRLEKERKEAERLIIGAKAKAEANDIINSSLTDKLLRMRGIEATSQLSESQNAKVVVIGSGKDGLPIILGNN